MSRGCGEIQRMLFRSVADAGKPVTYGEIVGALLQASGVNDPTTKLRSDRERAIRRALKGLCDRDLLSTLGSGRPGDPYRYTQSNVCVVCRGEATECLETGKGTKVCFRCAGAIAQSYFDLVLPQAMKRRVSDSDNRNAVGVEGEHDASAA
jgi:hypothetical protein